MKILVVDDSWEVVKLIEDILKLKGLKDVEKAYSFEEGARKIKNGKYDVYIIDYHISFKNGLELAEMAKNKGEVIIITGDSDLKIKNYKIFYKPFNVSHFSKYILSLQKSK